LGEASGKQKKEYWQQTAKAHKNLFGMEPAIVSLTELDEQPHKR
jgi:hypothetical protein